MIDRVEAKRLSMQILKYKAKNLKDVTDHPKDGLTIQNRWYCLIQLLRRWIRSFLVPADLPTSFPWQVLCWEILQTKLLC